MSAALRIRPTSANAAQAGVSRAPAHATAPPSSEARTFAQALECRRSEAAEAGRQQTATPPRSADSPPDARQPERPRGRTEEASATTRSASTRAARDAASTESAKRSAARAARTDEADAADAGGAAALPALAALHPSLRKDESRPAATASDDDDRAAAAATPPGEIVAPPAALAEWLHRLAAGAQPPPAPADAGGASALAGGSPTLECKATTAPPDRDAAADVTAVLGGRSTIHTAAPGRASTTLMASTGGTSTTSPAAPDDGASATATPASAGAIAIGAHAPGDTSSTAAPAFGSAPDPSPSTVAIAAAAQEHAQASDTPLGVETRPASDATPSAHAFAALATPAGLATAPSNATPPAPVVPTLLVAAPFGTPAFAGSLAASVSLLARDGVQQARLQVHPAELGPIAVQIALDGTQARVDFTAEVAATRHAIEAGLPELASALRESGLTLAGGGVFRDAPQGQPQARREAHDAPRRLAVAGDASADERVSAPQRRRFVALGSIDEYA